MQARKPQATKIARSIAAAQGSSTIANLENRTTPEAAAAPRAPGLRVGQSFTGQYLWNRLIADDKAEQTKMDIVRAMVGALDVEQCKKVLADFVAIPTGYRDNLIKQLKKDGAYNADKPTPELATILAQLKTAQNHQSVLRVSYGAIKFCAPELASFGYTETTGYLVMQVIARKALAAKGIKWDGTKVLEQAQVERKAAAKQETKALEKVMEATPRADDESMPQYLDRCGGLVADQLAKDNAEREAQMIKDLAAKFRKMAGSLIDEVVDAVLRGEGIEQTEGDDVPEELTIAGSVPAAAAAVHH